MLEAFMQLRDVRQAFSEADEILRDYIGKSTCVSSCGKCCMVNVPNWMTIEAIYALSVLTGAGRLEEINQIAEGWLLEHHSSATIYEGMCTGFLSPNLKGEWQSVMRSQCPFLDSKLECVIHDVRPLSCMACGVTREVSEICPRPLGRGESDTQRMIIPAPLLRNRINELRAEWKIKNPAWIVSGSVPSVFYRASKPEKFKEMVLDNKIASAKIIGTEYEASIMWQPQVNALRQGIIPDLALSAT